MISLDSTLSVYGLVTRTIRQRALIQHRRTMEVISNTIENVVIQRSARARVFSAFQYFSRFTPQVARYRRLAQNAEHVYCFGVMDIEPPQIDNVTYVPLKPTDQLAREWFLIADAPTFYCALATEEVTKGGERTSDREFEGVWSFDEDMVTILQEWLTSLLDAHTLYRTPLQRNYVAQMENMSFMLTTLADRLDRIDARYRQRTNDELRAQIDGGLTPARAGLEASAGE